MICGAGEVVVGVVTRIEGVAVAVAETVCYCAAIDTWKNHGIARAVRELNSAYLHLVVTKWLQIRHVVDVMECNY